MRNVLILILIVLFNLFKAQPPSKFYVVYGGPGDDIGYEIKQCLDGNYILVGSSSSSGNGQTDVYLLKIDSMGRKMWERYIGGAGSEVGRSIEELPDSGFVITGFTSSYGNGGYDLYIFRTDKIGNVLWQRTVGGNDWDFGYGSALTGSNEIMAAGCTYSNGNQDVLLVKMDTSGNTIWEKRYGGQQEDAANTIYSPDGINFFLAGITKSGGEINGDIYLIKTDLNGDTLFTKTYGHNSLDYANDVVTDTSGNILLASAITYSNGNKDAAIIKTNSVGTQIWEKSYGLTPENKEIFNIIRSANPILGEEVAIFSANETPGYNKDAKTIYINSGGDFFGGQFSGSFGFPQDDEIFSISACKDEGYISCGYTRSFSQSASNKDIFIVKRDSTLNYGVSIVGLNESASEPDQDFYIYPNPFKNGTIGLNYILSNKRIEVSEVTLFDAFSKAIELDFLTDKNQILVPLLSQGVYYLQLKTNQGILRKKLLIY